MWYGASNWKLKGPGRSRGGKMKVWLSSKCSKDEKLCNNFYLKLSGYLKAAWPAFNDASTDEQGSLPQFQPAGAAVRHCCADDDDDDGNVDSDWASHGRQRDEEQQRGRSLCGAVDDDALRFTYDTTIAHCSVLLLPLGGTAAIPRQETKP